MADLNLRGQEVPLIAGEVVNADHGGTCASMNSIIATLPEVIPNSYVISSAGLSCAFDHLHLMRLGIVYYGQRYAAQALKLLGVGLPTAEELMERTVPASTNMHVLISLVWTRKTVLTFVCSLPMEAFAGGCVRQAV
jgi:hypothetical protein